MTCVTLAANITSALVSVNSSNQRFFLKFARHAQSVRCIFCNYCENILRFCFLRRVFLLRWPIIWTCGIQKRLKQQSLLPSDGNWWRCSRLMASWLHLLARACAWKISDIILAEWGFWSIFYSVLIFFCFIMKNSTPPAPPPSAQG